MTDRASNGSLVRTLVVQAQPKLGPIYTNTHACRRDMCSDRHIYTVQKGNNLWDGDAEGGGNNLRFFGRRFRGWFLFLMGGSVVADITDGMMGIQT
jgi:hypothetical protein